MAAVVAKSTAVTPTKLVPWMMIVVPPLVGALPPKSWVTVGALTYVNSSAGTMAEVPAAVVTVMSTVPSPGAASEAARR